MGQETVAEWRAALAVASAGYTASSVRPLRASDPAQVGPYRLEAVLGQGGMGRVFLARQEGAADAAAVALKVLSQTGDATARARFRRELAAARRVEGDGTARVLDGDPDADPPWLATEYIDGPTLDRLVAERGPLSVRAAAGLAVGVAGALSTIHTAGVVHRDLKPANIILAPDGPRVVDFGIARTADATTLSVSGWTMGTPGYMAPEQIADPRSVGPAVDVFALGAVLVFATTALSPYSGGDAATVIYRIVHGEPNLDGVPDELRELVTACLAKSAEDRPRLEAVAATGLRIVDLARQNAAAALPAEPILPDPTLVAAATVITPIAPVTPSRPVTPLPETGERSVRPTADSFRARRIRRGPLGLLVALVVAALGVTSWFAVAALARPSHAATAGTTTHSATAGAKKNNSASSVSAFAGGTVLAGPGCASSKWTVFSITSGSLETGIAGGDPACGGTTDTFRKSGNASESGSSANWAFAFKRPVTCTLRIYIANADPSSGFAVYKVTANGRTNRFRVSQADNKGKFAANAALDDLAAPDGVIKLTLTDISVLTADKNHVTASSVSAACRLG
ncbi:serine/threonine-protein kinase [Actinospica sp.]|uniref:serine/threonine-protein kinase n=1 Tax=Actinospica sp. TaxID=1872142 RepID=UPI002C8964AE|nr:serine/threonine-protein kinase [Actinospica sp.]HWG25759.1 serine/threonine-protein kinase [Actinospica sp.]